MGISPAQLLQIQMRLANGRKQPVPQDAVEEESPLHDEIANYCRSNGWGYVHSQWGKKTRSTAGCPDFIVLASGGRTFYVEAKDRDGKLSAAQLGFKIQAEMNGHQVHVVRSFQQFLEIVNQTL